MTTNEHAAYEARILPDGYRIYIMDRGRCADEEVARFDSYDDVLHITESCGIVDVYGAD